MNGKESVGNSSSSLHISFHKPDDNMTSNSKYNLKSEDFSRTVTQSFGLLRREQDLCDVTLVSEDEVHIDAHKVVLSACSKFFKSLLGKLSKSNPSPLIYLGGVTSKNLNYVLDYIYVGEVQLLHEDVDDFLDYARKFKIYGLGLEKETRGNEAEADGQTHNVTAASSNGKATVVPKKETQDEIDVNALIDSDSDSNEDDEQENDILEETLNETLKNSSESVADLEEQGEDAHQGTEKSNVCSKDKSPEETSSDSEMDCDITQTEYPNDEAIEAAMDLDVSQSTVSIKVESVEQQVNQVLKEISSVVTQELIETESTAKETEDSASGQNREEVVTKIRILNAEEADLKTRELTERIENGFKCQLCQFVSKIAVTTYNHIEKIHFEGFAYTCQTCGKQFESKRHFGSHRGRCDKNDILRPSKSENPETRKILTEEEVRKQLGILPENTGNVVIAKVNPPPNESHMLEKSDLNLKKLREDFRKMINKTTTMEKPADPTPKSVEEVGKIHVQSNSEAKERIKDLVMKDDDLYICQHCGFSSATKQKVTLHAEKHIEGLLYDCQYCDKQFKLSTQLWHHKSMHTRGVLDEKESDETLNATKDKEQKPTDDTPQSNDAEETDGSEQQQQQFWTSLFPKLQGNEVQDEREEVENEDHTSSFKIKVSSNGEAAEKIKELIVKDDDVYKCKFCGHTSKHASTLQMHAERHFEGIEYSCESCDKRFKTKNSFNAHKSIYHRKANDNDDDM